jgi:Ca2+-binding RTX toxin-like protein
MLAAAVPVLCLIAASSASGAIKCQFQPAKRLLVVDSTEKNLLGGEAELVRFGDGIVVSNEETGRRVDCHGTPTVSNTDRIKLRALGLSSITIALSGGPFEPIEMTAGGGGLVIVSGGPAADHFSYVSAAGRSGLSLDPGPDEEDIDLLTPDPRTLLIAEGGGGADTIDVPERTRIEVQERGGPGNDDLSALGAGSSGVIIEGDSGADQILGSPGEDIITPGSGPDQVQAEGGADEIKNPPDRSKDSIECGGGHDLVVQRDPFDRLRSCETVRPFPFA